MSRAGPGMKGAVHPATARSRALTSSSSSSCCLAAFPWSQNPTLACTRLRADPPARLNHTWPFQGRLSDQRGSRPPRSTLSPSQQPACAQARPRTRPRRLLLGQRAATEWCITCVYAAPQAPAWRRMRMVLPASSRRCMRRAEATCAVARPWRPAPTPVPHAGSCRPSQRARRAWPQGEWRKGARAGA